MKKKPQKQYVIFSEHSREAISDILEFNELKESVEWIGENHDEKNIEAAIIYEVIPTNIKIKRTYKLELDNE